MGVRPHRMTQLMPQPPQYPGSPTMLNRLTLPAVGRVSVVMLVW
jgi:hypothetical protein